MATRRAELKPGLFLLYDEQDESHFQSRKWHAMRSGRTWYAAHKPWKSAHVFFHNLVMPPTDWLMVDHINRDGLDCRRENLRLVTKAQNMRNRRINKNNTSGFKGVTKVSRNRWRAQIRVDGVDYRGRLWPDPEMAAREYDLMSRAYHGQYGATNEQLVGGE